MKSAKRTYRRFRREMARSRLSGGKRAGRRGPLAAAAVTLLIALTVAAGCTAVLEARLRPMVVTVAQAQAEQMLAAVIETCVLDTMEQEGAGYQTFVRIHRDEDGAINSLTTDIAGMNRLRARLIEAVLEVLEGIDVSQIQIPLCSLLDFDILWGLGPSLKVHAMTVGSVNAEFTSQFSSAGVNQTLHEIDLEVTVPVTLMLPGGAVETVSRTSLCVAETVIVGQVPDVCWPSASG